MSRARGTYSVIDNTVLEFLKRNRNASASVLLVLAERANYSKKAKAVTVPEIMMETGLKERAAEMACMKLQANGYAYAHANGYVYGDTQQDTQQDTQEAAETQALNTVQHTFAQPLKEVEGSLEGSKDVKAVLVGANSAPAEPSQPDTATQNNEPQTPAPSQDVQADPAQGEATAAERTSTPVPAPRPEYHGDDHDAVQFFHGIAGYNFVQTYRLDLARWTETYTPEFIRLAHRLAPTLPGGKGFYVLADLLNRDPRKPWPDALTRLYVAEQRQTGNVAGRAPELGEILVCGDQSGRVIEVDTDEHRVSIQIGRDATEYITVPWGSTRPAVSIGRTA